MGFLTPFKSALALQDLNPQVGLASPWSSPNHLQNIVVSDLFGATDLLPVTRADAVRVPAVSKARALICGTIARLPLKAYKSGGILAEQPAWLYRTNGNVSPQQRMLWTMDDLVFNGFSLWAVERGAQGQITDAARVPLEWWEFSNTGEIKVNGEVAKADQVILFAGFQEGFTEIGAHTVRAFQDLESTRSARLRNPVPSIVLHATEDLKMDPSEVQAIIDAYAATHQSSSLSISYLPHNLNVEEHGSSSPEMFLQLENTVNAQVAQLLNVPATMLEASVEGTSSLTYQNSQTERSHFIDTTINYWAGIIEAQLSMDDVSPRGTYIQFDLSSLTNLPQASPALED